MLYSITTDLILVVVIVSDISYVINQTLKDSIKDIKSYNDFCKKLHSICVFWQVTKVRSCRKCFRISSFPVCYSLPYSK